MCNQHYVLPVFKNGMFLGLLNGRCALMQCVVVCATQSTGHVSLTCTSAHNPCTEAVHGVFVQNQAKVFIVLYPGSAWIGSAKTDVQPGESLDLRLYNILGLRWK